MTMFSEAQGQTCSIDIPEEFKHIRRVWDNASNACVADIKPGEYYVTNKNELITTVLGSCVSACIRDRSIGLGGMNHFMLPKEVNGANGRWEATDVNEATRYGNYAMEHLINDILKQGGNRKFLEIKIFGGCNVLPINTNVGQRNIDFVRKFLFSEGYTIQAESVGHPNPLKVEYNPKTGKARIKKLGVAEQTAVVREEEQYQHDLDETPTHGDMELF